MNNHKIYFLVCCLFSVGFLHGQSEIEAENLEVIKTFEAQLENAVLVEVRPTLPKIVPIKKAYKYEISIVPIDLEYPDPVIKPLAMTETNTFESDNYYLKLGYGNMKNPEGVLRLSFYDGDRYNINTNIGYAALDNSEEVAFQKMSSYNAGVDGFARLNENVVLDFDGGFGRNVRSFYDTRDLRKELNYGEERTVDNLYGTIGISNIDKVNSSISYDLSSVYKIDRIKSEAFSSGVGLSLKAEKRASDNINIVMPIKTMLYVSNIENTDKELLLFDFSPHMHFQTGRFMASIGVNIYHDQQLKTNFWPSIEMAYGIIQNYVQVIAGTHQNYRANDLGHLMNYNPYVEIDNFSLRSTLWKEYYGGLRGELNFLSYQAELGYKQAENEILIYNDIVEGEVGEQLVYDQMNTTFLRGSLNFALSNAIDLGGSITANIYDPTNEEEAWGLPALELNSYLKWQLIKDKLLWKSNLFIADQVFTKEPTGLIDPQQKTIKLNNLIELDTQIEYWPVKQFSIYAYGHNLLNNKYQRWYGYPMVGLNVGGGFQVKF